MSRVEVDPPAVHEFSAINAERHPNGLAVVDEADRLTWTAYEDRSRVAADAFDGVVAPGDRVCFLCGSSVDHAVLWNGALKAGTVVNHVPTRASPDTVRYCLETLRPAILVVDGASADVYADRVRDLLDPPVAEVVRLGVDGDVGRSLDEFLDGAEPRSPDVLVEEDDVAAVWWTSGTTGRPKGWCHTHRTITLKGMEIARTHGLNRTHTSLGSFSPSFAAWYNVFTPVLITGATMVFLGGWDPAKWARLADEHDVTHAGLVPTMWRAVLKQDLDAHDLDAFEHVTFTGEKMDRSTLERLREQVCEEVSNAYASTEVNVTSMYVEEMVGDRLESVGKPEGGTRVRVIEPGGDPTDTQPPDEVGEIVVRAPDCPVWIWGDTARTHDQFVDGWWYPGDMGYLDEDGYLYVEGREDFMIKSKGVKVFPGPIEEVLNNHPGVDEAAVVGVEDPEYGQRVTAVVNRSEADLGADELDGWCLESDQLARFERPREYVFADEPLPRTPTGKLDRNAVRQESMDDA